MKNSIFVSHPGLQHSHQMALALHEHGLLQAYWSGVPVLCPDEAAPLWLPPAYTKRIKRIPIPRSLRRHLLLFQVLMRIGQRLPDDLKGDYFDHRIFHLYDWWVSRWIRKLRPKVVVAYENSAYHTFRAAKTIGARCVLDAASLHHSVGSSLGVDKPTAFLAEINRRKDIEVELADMVITCSPLAAESYHTAGVPASKLRPMLLGADIPTLPSIWQPHDGPLHYVFAGALRYLKSIDIILAVFRRLHAENLPARVSFVGGVAEARWLDEIRRTPNAEYLPNMPQAELFKVFSMSDGLLLPSRFDSFGMVVAEAMACGTPAIVSSQTGAKAIIEQFPGSGWIVEPDEESLYRRLRQHIANREQLFLARKHARVAAAEFTWSAYRRRVGRLFEAFLS